MADPVLPLRTRQVTEVPEGMNECHWSQHFSQPASPSVSETRNLPSMANIMPLICSLIFTYSMSSWPGGWVSFQTLHNPTGAFYRRIEGKVER